MSLGALYANYNWWKQFTVWSLESAVCSLQSANVIHRLRSEPDNKQTYRPVQPREFVEFSSDDLTLENLKIVCAEHFGYPVNSCDVLVSNKGPSCTNINQIPHRKDKVSKLLVVYWENCQMHQIDLFRPETHKGLKGVARVQYSWIFTFTRSRLWLLLLPYIEFRISSLKIRR